MILMKPVLASLVSDWSKLWECFHLLANLNPTLVKPWQSALKCQSCLLLWGHLINSFKGPKTCSSCGELALSAQIHLLNKIFLIIANISVCPPHCENCSYPQSLMKNVSPSMMLPLVKILPSPICETFHAHNIFLDAYASQGSTLSLSQSVSHW